MADNFSMAVSIFCVLAATVSLAAYMALADATFLITAGVALILGGLTGYLAIWQ